MWVTVELQATLEGYAPDGQPVFECEIPEGSRVEDLVRRLGIPEQVSGVVIVADTVVDPWHQLQEGDRVTIIPPLAGGYRAIR